MGRDTLKIIFDTNFLILPVKEKVDLFAQIRQELGGEKEFFIVIESLKELQKLKYKGLVHAKVALENVLKQEIKILDIKGGPTDVDDKIVHAALKQNAFIATLDKELIIKAKSKGLKIVGYNKSKKKAMVN
jgi:rRNA-processing protein FCF1